MVEEPNRVRRSMGSGMQALLAVLTVPVAVPCCVLLVGCGPDGPPNLDIRVIVGQDVVDVNAAEPDGCRHTLDFGEVGTCRQQKRLALEPVRCSSQKTCLTSARLEHEGQVLAEVEGDVSMVLELTDGVPEGATLVLAGCKRETRVVLPAALGPSEQVSEVVVTDTDFEPRWTHSATAKTAFSFVFEPFGLGDSFTAACHTPIDEARVPYDSQSLGYSLTSYALALPQTESLPIGTVRLFPARHHEERVNPPF